MITLVPSHKKWHLRHRGSVHLYCHERGEVESKHLVMILGFNIQDNLLDRLLGILFGLLYMISCRNIYFVLFKKLRIDLDSQTR